jgi:hypothetical protein
MISEQNTTTKTATGPDNLKYEYLQVRASVGNFTKQPMVLTGSDLSWGKWIQSPVDVPGPGMKSFASQGRDMSPSGTEGWATWKIGNAVIRVTFSCPLKGPNDQTIKCTPDNLFKVSCEGTGGDVNTITYSIEPA